MGAKKQYWFVSYVVTGKGGMIYENCTIDISPAEWAARLEGDPNIDDSPYVILYAEKLTKEQWQRMDRIF